VETNRSQRCYVPTTLIITLYCVQNVELADKVATMVMPQEASRKPSVSA